MNTDSFDVANSLESELDALWRFGLRLTSNPDDAADLVQRTCVRALEQRHKYAPQGKFRSWLFQILHRIWLNELRSRKVRAHDHLDTTQSTIESDSGRIFALANESGDDSTHTGVFLEQVYLAIEQLPQAQRLVILLVNVEGRSYQEAADILEVPIGTVMSRLARARIAIGKMQLDTNSNVTTTSTPQESRKKV